MTILSLVGANLKISSPRLDNLLRGLRWYFRPHFQWGKKRLASELIRKLSVLVSAGVPVGKAFTMIVEGYKVTGKQRNRTIFRIMTQEIEKGESLYHVFSLFPQYFNTMVTSLIHVGEESGRLPEIIEKIMEYQTTENQYRKKLLSALTYPAIVLAIAVITIIFLTYFLLPMFGDMYADMNMTLPTFTHFLLSISHFESYMVLVAIGVVSLFVYTLRILLKKPAIRQYMNKILRNIVLIGPSLRRFVTMYYSQILQTLLESGLTLLDSLKICRQIAKRSFMKEYFAYIIKHLEGGKSFSELLAVTNMLDYEFIKLIEVSEESGQITQAVGHIRRQVESELKESMDNLGAVIEPLIIVFLGLTIGAVIIGMYLPIFELSTNIGM